MSHFKKCFTTFILSILFVCFAAVADVAAESECVNCESEIAPVADVTVGTRNIGFQTKVEFQTLILSVSGPDGTVFTQSFESGSSTDFELPGLWTDGSYTYELRVIPVSGKKDRLSTTQSKEPVNQKARIQTGSFLVQGGKILTGGSPEGIARPKDSLVYDDQIVTGSICVGFDCANGESFGYCTLKLKENNLQLCFEDTSAGSFPTNDWKIQINDTTSGGASYFTIWDTDGGRRPFTLEAGAPAHSLYVEDYGRVGLGTSIPYVELHIVDGDSPTVRLDQDGSSGWTAQRWDLCGNETNFFIRDVTNGSKLCFRIQPNTPSNTLCMRSSGDVGIGTWSPGQDLEIEKTDEDIIILCDRTDGASAQMAAKEAKTMFGSRTNHQLNLTVNNQPELMIDTDGDVAIGKTSASYKLQVWNDAETGYGYSDGGAWNTGSSREFKENIKDLTADAAMEAFKKLNPIRYYYKGVEEKDEQLGFIAEDVPEIVATNNRDAISAMDIVTLLTKVVQEQQKSLDNQQKTIDLLKKEIDGLKKK